MMGDEFEVGIVRYPMNTDAFRTISTGAMHKLIDIQGRGKLLLEDVVEALSRAVFCGKECDLRRDINLQIHPSPQITVRLFPVQFLTMLGHTASSPLRILASIISNKWTLTI
jgi:hypothetical protein